MAIGIIAGSSLLATDLFEGLGFKTEMTEYGSAEVWTGDGFFFIQRHGKGKDILPHLINHKANIQALKTLGVTAIIALCSTGSYKEAIPPGSIVLPHDFICLETTPTFYGGKLPGLMEAFTLPGIDRDLREDLIKAAHVAGVDVIEEGVYLQVRGPRLETKAEVSLFKGYADIVGMTMASEAVLAKEAGLKYAAICQVDNYGRGISGKDIDFTVMESVKGSALTKARSLLEAALKVVR